MTLPEKESILLGTALLLAAMVAGAVIFHGWSEEAVRIVVRASARVAVLLFSLAFSASALQALFPSPGFAWLLRSRRYVGLSFALAHTLHLAALFALGFAFPSPFFDYLDAPTVIGGGLAYVFIYALALTSTDAAVARLGRPSWRRLHLVGSWYVWLIFTQTYVPEAIAHPAYIPMAALPVAALALRIARWRKLRARKAH